MKGWIRTSHVSVAFELRSFHGLKLLLIILLFFVVLNGPMVRFAHAETQPTIQITSVDYPQTVLPGKGFNVKVNAWYSGAFLSDVGVWDLNSGLMVQSMTYISQFTGPGNVSFTLSLAAPSSSGVWHLLAINRVWWQNAWYQDPKGGEEPFTVDVVTNLTLTLGSIGASAKIAVDGHPYEIQNDSSVSAALRPGAHVLEAPMVIEAASNMRYVFVGWSNGVNSNPQSIFLAEPMAIYALFRTDYYLSAQSDMGQIAGGGWYPEGAQATVAVTPTAVTDQFGLIDEYSFAGWSGVSNSTSNDLVLTMDGPKQIRANWTYAGEVIDSIVVEGALLLCCLPLLGRLVILRHRRSGKSSPRRQLHSAKRGMALLLMLGVLVMPLIAPAAHAQLLPQPNAPIITIGDARWYYWAHPGSDTCLIWLGGGVPEQTEPGSYAYFINPYAYESFDTIRFIQDLTSYYCVVALQQGSVRGFNPAANRTIYQELFQPETAIIEEVHAWVEGQGYAHTFVVGYSVGGQAAVADLTLSHAQDWTTEDGIILITVPFSQDVLNNARELRTNLFIIYGGNLQDYEATGEQFYNATQTEGVHGTQYFHKEFHAINDAGHEVWTLRATGAYDRQALNLIIGFIERSKTLQITHGLEMPFSDITSHIDASVLSVQAPAKVDANQAFLVRSNVTFKGPTFRALILIAYNSADFNVSSEVSLAGNNGSPASIVIPPISQNAKLTLTFVTFQNSSGIWIQASNPYSTTVVITDLVNLTVQSFPGVVFYFDGRSYSTNSSGFAEIPAVRGQYLVEAQSFIYLSNASRLRFVGWEDLTNQTPRQISLAGDRTIEVLYVQQYLVQVSSVYGQTVGSGWYDANSTLSALVQPPLLSSPRVIFSHWTPINNQSEVSFLAVVTAPETVSAVWDTENLVQPGQLVFTPMIIVSILALVVLVILNLRLRRSKRSS